MQTDFNEGGILRVRARMERGWHGGELIRRPHHGERENLGEQNGKIDVSQFYLVLALSVSN